MADDKKNIPDVASPTEAPAPTVEKAVVPEQPAPEPALTDAEVVMLEHEGQAALFEMGEAVPDPADAVTRAEVEEPAAPEVPKAEKEQAQSPDTSLPIEKIAYFMKLVGWEQLAPQGVPNRQVHKRVAGCSQRRGSVASPV